MPAGDVDILVVDDRHEDLLVIDTILGDRGYNLVTATSGTDALRKVLERDFAVILLDIRMPDMDGFDLAGFIKQRERSRLTPIIFLTAVGPEAVGSIYRGYSVGAVDYLMKPLDPDVLRAKVSIFVELFRKDRRIREQAEALRAAEVARLERANQRRYRNLADAIPQIVFTASSAGTLDFVNRRWTEYTGLEPDQVRGSSWMSLVHPDDADRVGQRWTRATESGDVFEIECRMRARDGGYRWFLSRAVAERDERNAVVAWLGTATDIDDHRIARDAAEAAVRARDEFLSIASHELRTPLTTLLLRMQSLEIEAAEGGVIEAPSLAPKVASSLRQTRRLIGLVDSLLDVSRISTGRLVLNRESFDLGDVASEVISRLATDADRARCEVRLHIEGRAVGIWDRLRIEQIVHNLLANAIKYAPGNPIDVRVSTRGDRAVLSVRDQGGGITPEDAAKLFQRFERGLTARQMGGLGLGLFIAQQICEAHGGTIRVDSNPGAEFTVELPLAMMVAPRSVSAAVRE